MVALFALRIVMGERAQRCVGDCHSSFCRCLGCGYSVDRFTSQELGSIGFRLLMATVNGLSDSMNARASLESQWVGTLSTPSIPSSIASSRPRS